MRVFVSYRRSDSAPYAGRLTDTLARRFGAGNVFHDVSAIGPGQDFVDAIERALGGSDAVLAVIGPGWSSAAAPAGRRLDDPADHVRVELATALRRAVRVVPVLVGGAALPAPGDLPDDLRGLPQRQAVVLHDETWTEDVDGLLRALGAGPAAAPRRRPRWVSGAALLGALLVGGAVAWWALPIGSGAAGGTASSSTYQAPLRCDPVQGAGWTPIALAAHPSGTESRPGGSIGYTVTDARWRADGQRWHVQLVVRTENATTDAINVGDWLYPDLVVSRRPWPLACITTGLDGGVAPGQVVDVRVGYDVGCAPSGTIALEAENAEVPVADATQAAENCPAG